MRIYTCSFLGVLFFIAFHTLDTQFDGPFLGVSGIHLTMAGLVDSARLQDNLQLLKDVEAVAFRSGQSESDQTPTAQAKSQTSLDAARGKVG